VSSPDLTTSSRLAARDGWLTDVLRKIAASFAAILTTLFGLLLLTFIIGRMIPADPVLAILGDNFDQAAYDRVYSELGLDRPVPEQFFSYVQSILQFDFGRSNVTRNSVAADLARVFPATLELAILAIFIGTVLGVPLGVVSAVKRGTWVDHLGRVVALLGYSAPIFWLGTMVILIFYARLAWIPGGGRIDLYNDGLVTGPTGMLIVDALLAREWEVFWSASHHIAAPALLLGYAAMAYLSRMSRSFMLEQLNQEYILTARAKGLGERPIVWKHAFRNIRVQLLTVIALAFCGLLDGAVLIETVFGWPGLGQYLTAALFYADMNAVLGAVLLIGLISILINLLTDVVYRFVDPRTR
jgi:peptide/nickel transport system permease protein